MVNVFAGNKKKEPTIEPEKQDEKESARETNPEQPLTVIQKLRAEEAQLADEKRNLLIQRDQLQKKIKEQIENSKNNVSKLKSEVDELKAECTELNESLENEVLMQ